MKKKEILRKIVIDALKDSFIGKIEYHKANVEIYLNNPTGIGEHPDILGAIEDELEKIAEYQEKLDVLENSF